MVHAHTGLPPLPKATHIHKQLFTHQLPPHTQTQLTQLESLSRILPLIINSPTLLHMQSHRGNPLEPCETLSPDQKWHCIEKRGCAGVGALFQVPVQPRNTMEGGQFDLRFHECTSLSDTKPGSLITWSCQQLFDPLLGPQKRGVFLTTNLPDD